MTSGSLYPTEFLLEGIKDYARWKSFTDEQFSQFEQTVRAVFASFPTSGNPLEATTEADLIVPVMKALGWTDYLSQQTTSRTGRLDIPDYLLFGSIEKKALANEQKEQAARYSLGIAVLEAKAWGVELDRKSGGSADRVPSSQILRYLTGAAVQSNDNIQWGILTNGRVWRLYYNKAKSKSEEYLEIDLAQILGLAGSQTALPLQPKLDAPHCLRLFWVLFGRDAFLPYERWPSFQEAALAEGKLWEEAVAKDLRDVVFGSVFADLLNTLQANDAGKPDPVTKEYLDELRENALILLYRLLFILYAEDRHLLPVSNKFYEQYSLQKIREEISIKLDKGIAVSKQQDNLFYRLKSVFEGIDKGDSEMGLPPYNGGLFQSGSTPILDRVRIPDSAFASILDRLSRRSHPGGRKWINYRDLSVQQLGSIYEGLLEFHPVLSETGIEVQPNIFARRTTGSYYTPDSLVKLIVEKTVGPLITERMEAFSSKAEELKASSMKKADRLGLLKRLDPATAILELKVCDPAMGSGHFLVSLVDYLADNVLVAMDEAEHCVPWADSANAYQSPLSSRIEDIRKRILEQAKTHNWRVEISQLDDRQIVRRMILKRCIYGVDKNPMAVELAKVSLWLHTFTVGAPLSFLDHHLRAGDSLFGEWVGGVIKEVELGRNSTTGSGSSLPAKGTLPQGAKRKSKVTGGTLFLRSALDKSKPSAQSMALIENLADTDIVEVTESAQHFARVQELTHSLDTFLRLYQAFKWLVGKDKVKGTAFNNYLNGTYGDPIEIAVGIPPYKPDLTFTVLLDQANSLAQEERFMNWEIAFPLVWTDWSSEIPRGGFDAIVGNPPWNRLKMQQVEWFAGRRREIALKKKAADRKKMIATLEKEGDPLFEQFKIAEERSKTASEMARLSGQFPMLSGGDINLYSLFVERAHKLVKPKGIVGLLVPSGISADKTASEFFKKVAVEGRLANLYDFENKKVFFPDVDSRFKFSVFVAGGADHPFENAQLAFYLHKVVELFDKERVLQLTPEDFLKVNPNTGTAPIFRSRKDANLTMRIYDRLPVLSDHKKEVVWPVRYTAMLHMSSKSGLFKNKVQVESLGYYPVELGHWKKGDEYFFPLYEGKMVQQYDHRAASVTLNAKNVNRPAQPLPTTENQHKNPRFYPTPQYYVHQSIINPICDYYFGFKEVTAPTNARTMIGAIIPKAGVGNKYPLLVSDNKYKASQYCFLLANFNSFAFDFILRRKLHGQTLNWFIIEQLPVVPPDYYDKSLGKITVGKFIEKLVLELSYTAYDLQPFAQDLGYSGEPFPWDEDRRRHCNAKLDALYFLLYGLEESEAKYVLSTFPIIKKSDTKVFGRYLTQDLILAYMRALKAGDTEATVRV